MHDAPACPLHSTSEHQFSNKSTTSLGRCFISIGLFHTSYVQLQAPPPRGTTRGLSGSGKRRQGARIPRMGMKPNNIMYCTGTFFVVACYFYTSKYQIMYVLLQIIQVALLVQRVLVFVYRVVRLVLSHQPSHTCRHKMLFCLYCSN